MGWKKAKNGWVQISRDNGKTLGGVPKEVAKKTSEKIDQHTDWWKKDPLERAKELEKNESRN
jgi:hypothetical protein